jgi:hypothetical protein
LSKTAKHIMFLIPASIPSTSIPFIYISLYSGSDLYDPVPEAYVLIAMPIRKKKLE